MKFIKLSFLFFISNMTYAQSNNWHLATEKELSGAWRIHIIPDELQKSRFKNKEIGYAASACRYIINKPNGDWYHKAYISGAGEEQAEKDCSKMLSSLLFSIDMEGSSQYQLKSSPYQEGLFGIVNAGDLRVIEWWMVQVADMDSEMPALNVALKKGDLFVQVVARNKDTKNFEKVWMMVLHSAK